MDLVWDAPDDPRVRGYELSWRRKGAARWSTQRIGRVERSRLEPLENGTVQQLRLRAVGADGGRSAWTPLQEVRVGPVAPEALTRTLRDAPLSLLLRTFGYALVHLLATRF